MKKGSEFIAVTVVILSTVGLVLGIFAIENCRRARNFTVELNARAPDNGNWYPRTITVPYGKEVKMLIRNIETVSHGFALPAFDIAVGEIKAGQVKTVTFTPMKRGTFKFMCTVWCSERHMEMNGELIVK